MFGVLERPGESRDCDYLAMRVLTDFHHSSLLRATNLLFGERLRMMVYRPIGLEWFDEGFWAINDQRDTAEQFLSLDQAFEPRDQTPALNKLTYDRDELLGERAEDGVMYVADPGGASHHRACTLAFFKENRFDYVIASIPAHIPLFRELIAKYQPEAKLIVQIGNEWPLELLDGCNVLASVKPRLMPNANPVFYHQEFDLDIFHPSPAIANRKIYSFINILQNMPLAWSDFTGLEMILKARSGYEFKSFGGQCRDGNMTGPIELADKMREAMMIFHVKEGGDGFGHIIYNAYAVGRPIITRSRFYKDRLAEELLIPGTFIDLDENNLPAATNAINRLGYSPDHLMEMGERAATRFREVVDYVAEANRIKQWLEDL